MKTNFLLLFTLITLFCGGCGGGAGDDIPASSSTATNGGSSGDDSGGETPPPSYPTSFTIYWDYDFVANPDVITFYVYYKDGFTYTKLCDTIEKPPYELSNPSMKCDISPIFATLDPLPSSVEITMKAVDINLNESPHSEPYTLIIPEEYIQ